MIPFILTWSSGLRRLIKLIYQLRRIFFSQTHSYFGHSCSDFRVYQLPTKLIIIIVL